MRVSSGGASSEVVGGLGLAGGWGRWTAVTGVLVGVLLAGGLAARAQAVRGSGAEIAGESSARGAAAGSEGTAAVRLFPAKGATGVNPDTHLQLTFGAEPAVERKGQVRVYDMEGHRLVDTLDLSISDGPDPRHRSATPLRYDPNPPTPRTTTPAVLDTPADLHSYQLTSVGGLDGFHFHPVLVHGKTAMITLHPHVLLYGHRYGVEIDPGVLTVGGEAFAGTAKTGGWTFATKAHAPSKTATQLVVAADGTGDFNTVQGALDFVPDQPAKPVTVLVRNGVYEELVFFQNKHHLTIRGESRDGVQIRYGNNSAFNPPMPGPSRRCAFSVYHSDDITLENCSVANALYGQSEGLLVYGDRVAVRGVTIRGSGDALNVRGSVYFKDATIVGDGDTILGVGAAFFDHCRIESAGPFMWIRNPETNHGNVFVDSTFVARPRPGSAAGAGAPSAGAGTVLGRLPNNHGLNYPYAEAVLIRCRLEGVVAEGWGPLEGDTSHLKLLEYASTDAEGRAIDVSGRNPAVRQLREPEDAALIRQYSDPAWVLGSGKW